MVGLGLLLILLSSARAEQLCLEGMLGFLKKAPAVNDNSGTFPGGLTVPKNFRDFRPGQLLTLWNRQGQRVVGELVGFQGVGDPKAGEVADLVMIRSLTGEEIRERASLVTHVAEGHLPYASRGLVKGRALHAVSEGRVVSGRYAGVDSERRILVEGPGGKLWAVDSENDRTFTLWSGRDPSPTAHEARFLTERQKYLQRLSEAEQQVLQARRELEELHQRRPMKEFPAEKKKLEEAKVGLGQALWAYRSGMERYLKNGRARARSAREREIYDAFNELFRSEFGETERRGGLSEGGEREIARHDRNFENRRSRIREMRAWILAGSGVATSAWQLYQALTEEEK